jgi:NADPH-dependent 2,4-dienoyl-CoA reductase/sulfur reductase-like enzyme
MKSDIIIIGAGPAGMAAAMGASRAGAERIIILERDIKTGGILNQCIHEGFGLQRYGQMLTGPEYAYREFKALDDRVEILCSTYVFDLISGPPHTVRAMRHGELLNIEAPSIILAMGCREKPAGAVGLPGTRPAGVFTAGTAQRLMNMQNVSIGKRVLIIGSGDIGLIMARRMTLEGAEVATVTEIQPYPGGLERNVRQCLDDFNIPLYLNTRIETIFGKTRVEGARLVRRQQDGSKAVMDITCDTILLSVGLVPENELTRKAGALIDPATGGPMVDQHLMTSVSGLYACGNVLQVHDIADAASREAEQAGYYAAVQAEIRNRYAHLSAGKNIRSITPQYLLPGVDARIMLRVTRPMEHITIRLRDPDRKVVHHSHVKALHPSQMYEFNLPGELIHRRDLEASCE